MKRILDNTALPGTKLGNNNLHCVTNNSTFELIDIEIVLLTQVQRAMLFIFQVSVMMYSTLKGTLSRQQLDILLDF